MVLFRRYFFCSLFILWKNIQLLKIQLNLGWIYWAPSNVSSIMLEVMGKTDEVYDIPLPSRNVGLWQETICMQIIQLAWKPTECKYGKVENKISQLDKNYAPDTLEHSSTLDKPNLFLPYALCPESINSKQWYGWLPFLIIQDFHIDHTTLPSPFQYQ